MLRDDFVYHNEDVRMDDEEDEDEAVLPMASSRIVMTTEDSATYQPKCSFLSCVTSTNFSSGGSQAAARQQSKSSSEQDQRQRMLLHAKRKREAQLETDVTSLIEKYVNARKTESRCSCDREACALRKFLGRNNLSDTRGQGKLRTIDSDHEVEEEEEVWHSLPPAPKGSSPELKTVHQDFIAAAGGRSRVEHMYTKLLELLKCAPDFLAPADPEEQRRITLLMILCCQPAEAPDNTRQLLHIFTVTLAVCCHLPEMLFRRNYQEASALELAALSNKSDVVRYLGLLYAPFGRDVNEVNSDGHSVLHLLARKGDAAADALETLLAIRSASGERLARLDVVNGGAKTPLDVANFCKQTYEQTSYRRVLSLFHETIRDQVFELMSSASPEAPAAAPPPAAETGVRNQF